MDNAGVQVTEAVADKQQVVGIFVRSPDKMMTSDRISAVRDNHQKAIKNAFGFDKEQLNYYMPVVNLCTSTFGIQTALDRIEEHLGENGILVIQFETALKQRHKANALWWLKPLMKKYSRVITVSINGMFTYIGENK